MIRSSFGTAIQPMESDGVRPIRYFAAIDRPDAICSRHPGARAQRRQRCVFALEDKKARSSSIVRVPVDQEGREIEASSA
jgi:hypothetical protein